MPTVEELVDHALSQAHERLQARCDRDGIVEIFEEHYGVFVAFRCWLAGSVPGAPISRCVLEIGWLGQKA